MSKTPGADWMPPRMIEVEAHGRDVPGEGDGLRFGLRFADGTEVAQDDETGLRGGIGPILFRFESSTSSGPEPSVDIVMRLWAWPLPPPGRVALTCSWPGAGLDAAEFAIDGPAIRAAAARAEPIWPED